MSIFKAYDVRGVVPDELRADEVHRIGRAVARWLGGEAIAVGRDARTSSPELSDALLRGITDEGVAVADLGLCSTPMVYFAVEDLRLAGGVMITASHNPAQYNGLKICREHAIPVGGDSGLRDIEKLAGEAIGPPRRARGAIRSVDVRDGYARHVLLAGGRCPPLRIAIDCGNGMSSVGLERLLETLPLEVERLYFEPDGTFPNHEADPLKRENLDDLVAAVRRSGAQLGVAFDGDGDRAMFVDDAGEPVTADLMTGLLARAILRRNPGGRVLYDLRSSRATAEAIAEAGGVPEMCRVGHAFIKAQMRQSGAVFAGELSGHFYFRFGPQLVHDDGTAALVALLDLLAETGRPLSELVRPLRRYAASGEINRRVADVRGLLAALEAEHAGADISKLDGLLVRHPDWWFNLRASNTEPVVRLNLEAADEASMRARRDALLARIEAFAAG
ncbi:MAG: phosphomannomutase/phosphoglucomutase [Proteobacteria bacterium]|nr:MAG: phosphomannomutase/phosphoglucomutase [Pseudomonadota bacterium]